MIFVTTHCLVTKIMQPIHNKIKQPLFFYHSLPTYLHTYLWYSSYCSDSNDSSDSNNSSLKKNKEKSCITCLPTYVTVVIVVAVVTEVTVVTVLTLVSSEKMQATSLRLKSNNPIF